MVINKICIIGLGLIGSSLARNLHGSDFAQEVVAVDISPKVCEKVMELGIVDSATTSFSKGVEDAEVVILAMSVGAIKGVADAIAPNLKKGAVVTDVGSVKGSVMRDLKEALPDTVEIVGGHPIAGTEHSGPEAGFKELFEGRWCILTPDENSDLRALDKVSAIWDLCGAKIEIMDAKRHDLILGITSHLPHLIAYSIVDTANELEGETKHDVIKFSASGFRGFTRIAASDPVMWRDVFLNNQEAVLEILGRFNEDLSALQKAIRKGDGDYLFQVFSRTREIRREVMERGEETLPSPDRKGKD